MDLKIIENRAHHSGLFPDQLKAIDQLKNFINDPKALEFTLAGSAGTGKTYLLKYFVNHVCNFAVCPTAPTHKAVRIIEKALGRKGKTLQSLHGLRPNLDISNFNIANPQFDPRGIEYIKDYKLVIIDEASMITDDLYELNHKRAVQYGTKILYVGDPLQLAPIQTNKSNGKVFNVSNKYVLTQIVRQEKGNPLLELFPLIRNDVLKGSETLLEHIFINRNNILDDVGYSLLSEINYKKITKDYFNLETLSNNLDYARIIAYTNSAVGRNNKFIRDQLLNNPKDILTIDDVLTSYTTIVDEFNFPIIINSEDYYVNTIRPYENQYGIKTYAINLQSAYDGRLTQTLQIADHTDPSFKKYYDILNHLHYEAINAHKSDRSRNWVRYYKFKDTVLTMVSFKLNEANNYQLVKKDIDYGYAITAHKSQGSTFDNVLIDLRDILYYKVNNKWRKRFDKDMINRLIYVGMSRASNKVIMKL